VLPDNQHLALLTDESIDVYKINELKLRARLPLVTLGFRTFDQSYMASSSDSKIIGYTSGGDRHFQYWYWQVDDLKQQICNRAELDKPCGKVSARYDETISRKD